MKTKKDSVRRYEAGENYKNSFFVDDFYLDSKSIKDTIAFIKEHSDFFEMACSSPDTLTNLMNKHKIDKSPLIEIMKDAFFQDEDESNYSVWMSISKFKRALEFCMINKEDKYLEAYLIKNPAMNKALVGHDHSNDPLLLACYGRYKPTIQKPIAAKPEPSMFENFGFFVASTVDSVVKAVTSYNSNESSEGTAVKSNDFPA